MKYISAPFGDIGFWPYGKIHLPVKFCLWALELENRLVEPFKVPIIKVEYAKNAFGGAFSTEHKGVTD